MKQTTKTTNRKDKRVQKIKGDGMITFHPKYVASSVSLFFNINNSRYPIGVQIFLKKSYNIHKVRKLLQQHPIWNTTTLIPVFMEEGGGNFITLDFKTVNFTFETIFTVVKELHDKILPILEEIEPLVRIKICPTCRHHSDIK